MTNRPDLARPAAFSAPFVIERELKESAFRALTLAFGAVFVFWYLLANIVNLLGDVLQVSLVAIPAVACSLIGLALVDRSFNAARAVWLVGLALAGLAALGVSQRSELAYLLAVFPLALLAVTFRWRAGLAGLGGLAALLAFLVSPVSPRALEPPQAAMIFLLGGLFLLLGAAVTNALYETAERSLTNYRLAREELERLREERVQLAQAQEDYALANKELARLSERLGALQQVAEEARRVKEDFVARVSHELRTPLNMIIGFSEVIMRSPQQYGNSIPSALLADIDSIMRNSHHLSRLVDDILDLSQVETGHMALTKEWASLGEVIEEAVSVVKGLFDSKGLYLRREAPADLPPVFCDSTRIRQVIINLLGNAARFTERGGVTICVRLENELFEVGIADTGTGISPTERLRVFEPFQQVDSSLRRHKGGTGLGLAISKQFVEVHGGRMWLESELGAGTTFLFTLPVFAPDAELQPREAPQRWFSPYSEYNPRTRAANLPAPIAAPRFVLVEDEDSLQRLFTRYMDAVDLAAVRSLEDAIAETQRSPARALVLNTPGGLEETAVQESLGRLPFGTPVISCWLPGREEAARRMGLVDYLVKPATREDIFNALAKVAGVKRVLLVDDEPEILRLFVRILSGGENGFSVLQAMDGRRALQLMRSRKPDVVLLDLVMPEMSGYQVLQEKSLDPSIRDIPVIVVSSQNPSGQMSMSKTISATRGSGLSVQELFQCIEALTGILVPEEQAAG